jgi:hypothetical protein
MDAQEFQPGSSVEWNYSAAALAMEAGTCCAILVGMALALLRCFPGGEGALAYHTM